MIDEKLKVLYSDYGTEILLESYSLISVLDRRESNG
jgi:hypothetical protein